VLSPEMITSKVVLDRFRREAETVAMDPLPRTACDVDQFVVLHDEVERNECVEADLRHGLRLATEPVEHHLRRDHLRRQHLTARSA